MMTLNKIGVWALLSAEYTSGITERINSKQELCGEERLGRFLDAHRELDLEQPIDKLLQHADALAEGQAPDDDVSMILFRDALRTCASHWDLRELGGPLCQAQPPSLRASLTRPSAFT